MADFAPAGSGWPKMSGRRGRPTNHSFSRETSLSGLSYDIKIWTDLTSVLSHAFDGRTDRQTAFSSLDHVCIPCSAVKCWTEYLTVLCSSNDLVVQAGSWSAVLTKLANLMVWLTFFSLLVEVGQGRSACLRHRTPGISGSKTAVCEQIPASNIL